MRYKEKNFASAVIYVHNAQDRAGDFLDAVMKVLEGNFEHSEIICVNDCSNDNSLQVIKNASTSARTTSISVLNMSYFHGVELAMNAGVGLSIGDFVFEFDNTVLDFEENLIMQAYERALQGYDIVSVSPDRKEKLSSRLFYKVFDCFADLPYKMETESFRILSRRVINRVSSMNKAVPYRKAVYANSGLKADVIKYAPKKGTVQRKDQKEREYKLGLAIDSLILFTEVGYRFAIVMTCVMMLMSVFMAVYSIVVYAASNPVSGWTTIILIISVTSLGMFGILTIIIKYLQLMIHLMFKRKQYSFESIEKLTK